MRTRREMLDQIDDLSICVGWSLFCLVALFVGVLVARQHHAAVAIWGGLSAASVVALAAFSVFIVRLWRCLRYL